MPVEQITPPPCQGVSVVIPTRGRLRLLQGLLDSLNEARSHFHYPSEIIVVDDSPKNMLPDIVRLCKDSDTIYISGPCSVREKRNIGINQSRYPVVLFVDSDCRVSPNLFEEHIKEYSSDNPSIAGVVGTTEFDGEENWMWDVLQRTPFLNGFQFAKAMEYAPWATCSNTSYRKEVLDELHGFETRWPFRLGSDDVDLGLRMRKLGYVIRCSPNATVYHARETWGSFFSVWRRAFRWGRMDVHVYYRRHTDHLVIASPGFRQLLPLLIVTTAGQTLLSGAAWMLLLPFLWLIVFLLLRVAFTLLLEKMKLREFGPELAASILTMGSELGILYEAVVLWEPTCFLRSVQRGVIPSKAMMSRSIAEKWSTWLAWLTVGLIQVGIMRHL